MTSEEWAQRFLTDEGWVVLLIGCAPWEICFNYSEAVPSSEFFCSFLCLYFARKPVTLHVRLNASKVTCTYCKWEHPCACDCIINNIGPGFAWRSLHHRRGFMIKLLLLREVNATSFKCLAALAQTMQRQMRSEKKSQKGLNTTSRAQFATLPLVKMVLRWSALWPRLQCLVVFQYGEWKATRPRGRGWSALFLFTLVVSSHRYPKLTRECRCCVTEMLWGFVSLWGF